MKYIALLLAVLCLAADPPVSPNPHLTPGVINTNVSVQEVLKHGYTAKPGVRKVSGKTHRDVFIRYFGRVPDHPERWEVDHLISLEIGGANDISNLWPQPYFTLPYNAHTKDKLENFMARMCRERLRTNGPLQAEALMHAYQGEIATNWIGAYDRYFGDKSKSKK